MGCSSCNQTRAEKIGSILTGWKNVLWKSKEIETEAIRRVEICADCQSNDRGVCLQCKCFIPAKARSMKENCPIDKWQE